MHDAGVYGYGDAEFFEQFFPFGASVEERKALAAGDDNELYVRGYLLAIGLLNRVDELLEFGVGVVRAAEDDVVQWSALGGC